MCCISFHFVLEFHQILCVPSFPRQPYSDSGSVVYPDCQKHQVVLSTIDLYRAQEQSLPSSHALTGQCSHYFALFEYTWAFRPWYRRWHNLLCELTLNTREENEDEIGRHRWHHILTLIYFHSQVQSSYLSDSILKPQCENSLI